MSIKTTRSSDVLQQWRNPNNPNAPIPQTELNGGSLTVSIPYMLLAGWLDGVGTITGEVDNGDPSGQLSGAGTVHPGLLNNGGLPGSGGLLNIVGNFQQTATGVLYIDISGPGSGMGQLNVQGIVTLGGTLHAVRATSFQPASGTFNFLQFQGIGGDFATVIIDNNSWTVGTVNHSFQAVLQPNGDVTHYALVVQ